MHPSRAPSSPSLPAPFWQRARSEWRGALVVGVAVTAVSSAWDPTGGALLQGVGLGACAALLWACSRAGLSEATSTRATRGPGPADAAPKQPADAAVADGTPRVGAEAVPAQAAEEISASALSRTPDNDASAEAPSGVVPRMVAHHHDDGVRFDAETEQMLARMERAPASAHARLTSRTVTGITPAKLDTRYAQHTHEQTTIAPRAVRAGASAPPARQSQAEAAPAASHRPPPRVVALSAQVSMSSEPTDPAEPIAKLTDRILGLSLGKSIVVGVTGTRASSGVEAKLACQLARLLAARRCPTLLLELDLETPALDRALGVAMPPLSGFSQQVFRRLHEPGAAWNVVRPSDNLSLLLEGRVRTPGILHGGAVTAELASLASSFRVIVAHLPVLDEVVEQPVFDAVTDALVLAVAPGQEAEATELLVQRFAKKPFTEVIAGMRA